MKKALIFRENQEPILVSADDIKNGLYSRNEEFVDPAYEYRVQFVSGARNNGGPYFRYYYSLEEFKKLYPDRASRYEIVAKMRRYEESQWHKRWKENVSTFCNIEKYTKDPNTNKYKYADAFYEETRTCIEFQHSYISFDFEERNDFYENLSINVIWLYDLTSQEIHKNEKGNVEILENNAKGFFRISENPENLKKHNVYIQVKSGVIYRVKELLRYDSSKMQKSTIRYFIPEESYTEQAFIEAIKDNSLGDDETCKPLVEWWSSNYSSMTVQNVETGDVIRVNCNGNGEMYRDFENDCIQYKYVDCKFGSMNTKDYSLRHEDEEKPIWVFIESKNIKNN